jgi:hypothetical protein
MYNIYHMDSKSEVKNEFQDSKTEIKDEFKTEITDDINLTQIKQEAQVFFNKCKQILNSDLGVLSEYLYKEITGTLFNELTRGKRWCKMINKTKIHNGLEFKPNTLHID